MNKEIQVLDKIFVPFLSPDEIHAAVQRLALKIDNDYAGKEILFIGVLNGVFVFAADLLRQLQTPCQITFVKVSSYDGTESSQCVKQCFGLNESLKGKHVILLEDIVDTGLTIEFLHGLFMKEEPASLEIASLLFKPEKYQAKLKIRYPSLEIPNDFVIGYGLDYDGYGRELNTIYHLKSEAEEA